jgi:hypothetical protein
LSLSLDQLASDFHWGLHNPNEALWAQGDSNQDAGFLLYQGYTKNPYHYPVPLSPAIPNQDRETALHPTEPVLDMA